MSDRSTCDFHDDRSKQLTNVEVAVSKQAGQWKVLLIVLSLFFMFNIGALTYLNTAVVRIELVFSNYMSQHMAEAQEGFRRITILEEMYKDHEERLDKLERGH